MIKVLHFVPELNGGGIESLLLNYYKNMSRNSVHFDFLVHSKKNGIIGEEFIKFNSKIYFVTPLKQNLFRYLMDFYKVLKSENYDIIHVHQNYISWFPLLLSMFFGIKTRISHSHNFVMNETKYKKFIHLIQRPLIKLFGTQYFACGKDAAYWLYGKEFSKNSSKVYVINNAIELTNFSYNKGIRDELRQELNINDKFCIGNVGRFAHQKNHEFLIDIFHEIYKINNNSVLLLVGVGELENKIKEKVDKLKLNHCVIFLGLRDDVNRLYQAMDVFLLPSFHEGLGVVLIESQASGLINYVSDTITLEANVSNKIKYISLKKSSKYWAECIINYDKKNNRTDIVKNLISAGFSVETEANKLVMIYKKLNKENGIF